MNPTNQPSQNLQSYVYGGGMTAPNSPASKFFSNPNIQFYGLPKPKVPEPTSKTIVTSDMAKSNFANQQQGFNNLEAAMNAPKNPSLHPTTSIVDLLKSQGKASDFASRSTLAQQYGIQGYTGTANQNIALMNAIQGGQTQQPTGTQTATPTTQTSGQTTTQPTQGVQSTTTPTSTDQLSPIIGQIQDLFDEHTTALNDIKNGTIPLTPAQQAQIDATQKTLDQTREAQVQANKSYEALVQQAQFRQGTNITNPNQFIAKNQQAISSDIARLQSLDNQSAMTVAQLKQSFMDKNYEEIDKHYTRLEQALKEKADLIDKIQSRADKQASDLRDFNERVRQFNEKQKLDIKVTNAQVAKIYQDIAKTKQEMEATIDPKTGKLLSTKPPTAEQSKAAGFASRLQQSNTTFDTLAPQITKLSTVDFFKLRHLPNALQPAYFQQQVQAERNFINAQLRRESGAAISPSEFSNAEQQYFPQPGDTPEVLAQKKANRELAQANLIREAGSAYDESLVGTVSAPQSNPFSQVISQIPIWNPNEGYIIPQ